MICYAAVLSGSYFSSDLRIVNMLYRTQYVSVEFGWNSTGWISILANVTLWHRLLNKSICTTEASDYYFGIKYSVIYVLLPINKII